MVTLKNILFFYLALLISSCAVTRTSSGINKPPTKSFVKIFHFTTIKSCHEKNKLNCKPGTFGQTGSGMTIAVFKGEVTVLTAGHVCDAGINENIVKEYSQIVYALDHNNVKHQAWPIHISLDDQISKGDLCLLWVPTLDVRSIEISLYPPKIGDELYYIGSPLGIYHPPTVPIFKGVYSGKINGSAAIATFPAIGGASGAAVFDKNNRIVGVVFAANQAFHHVTLITTYKSLKLFLKEAKIKFNNTQQ